MFCNKVDVPVTQEQILKYLNLVSIFPDNLRLMYCLAPTRVLGRFRKFPQLTNQTSFKKMLSLIKNYPDHVKLMLLKEYSVILITESKDINKRSLF